MKTIIFIFCIISLFSCKEKEEIYKQLHSIGMEIINEPDRVLNLKSYYPEYYNDSIIYAILKDTVYLKTLRDEIKYEFNTIDKSINTFASGTTQSYLDMFTEVGYTYKVKPEDVYNYSFQKDNICVTIQVIKKDNKFYFFHIKEEVCFPYD